MYVLIYTYVHCIYINLCMYNYVHLYAHLNLGAKIDTLVENLLEYVPPTYVVHFAVTAVGKEAVRDGACEQRTKLQQSLQCQSNGWCLGSFGSER